MSFQESIGWKQLGLGSRTRPQGRSGHSLVSDNKSRCYLFGGFDGEKCFNDLFLLTVADERTDGEWIEIDAERRQTETRPSERASHAACGCGTMGMFLMGGSGEKFGYSSLEDVFFFSYVDSKWYDISHTSLTEARGCGRLNARENMVGIPFKDFEPCSKPPQGYGRAAVYDEKNELVWVFGGTDGTFYTNDLWCLQLLIGSWSRLALSSGERPSPRYLSKMVMVDDRLIIVGGCIPPYCFASAPIEVFQLDLKTLSWSQIKPAIDTRETVPRARFAHGLAQLDGNSLFVFGGSARDIDRSDPLTMNAQFGGNIRSYADSKMYEDSWIYHVKENEWRRIRAEGETPGCLDFLAAASLRGGKDVVVFGGYNKKSRSNRMLRLRLTHVVPSLEDLCVKRLQIEKLTNPESFVEVDLEGLLPEGLQRALFA